MHQITRTIAFRTSADKDDYRFAGRTEGRKSYTAFLTLDGSPYGMVNLKKVREALDEVTLQDGLLLDADPEGKVVKVNLRSAWSSDDLGRTLDFKLGQDGKIHILAPCGETRRFSVRTLDRVLTKAGY
jgi:hypothetical protein